MTATVFDTHAAVTTLRGAGFDERQAEGVVSMVRQALSEGVATKADIKDVRGEIKDVRGEVNELRGEIKNLRGEIQNLEGRIESVEDRMATKEDLARFETRMYVSLLAAVGAVVALMKLLP